MTVLLDRVGAAGDLAVIGTAAADAFTTAVCAELPRHGTRRPHRPIIDAVYAAAADPGQAAVGVAEQRAGALERVPVRAGRPGPPTGRDRRRRGAHARRARRVGAHRPGQQHPGVSAVGAATILAETGDPTRFGSARALVKHAGLCPRANESGHYSGTTTISGRGRPELRAAAWRVVFAALQHNPVMAARHAHLTGRAERPLADNQARIAIAAGLLRQLHAVIVTATPWNAAIAAGHRDEQGRRCRLSIGAADHGAGASSQARRDHEPVTDHEQPRPSATKPG